MTIQSRVEFGKPHTLKKSDDSITTSLEDVDQYMRDAINELNNSPAREGALYHLNTGGNRLRSRLALASGETRLSRADNIIAAAACELLHNASLVHDDISDCDLYRRGQLTVHACYGNDVALCTGDLLLTAAFNACADIHDIHVSRHLLKTLARAAARIIAGQSIELNVSNNAQALKLKDYLESTSEKTSPLIELSLGIGLVCYQDEAYNETVCRSVAEAIGLAYQILDDLDDLQPTHNGSSEARLHNLHAWVHHQQPGACVDPHETLKRCLKHVAAALKRANRLNERFPEPLKSCVVVLINSLTRKASQASLSGHV